MSTMKGSSTAGQSMLARVKFPRNDTLTTVPKRPGPSSEAGARRTDSGRTIKVPAPRIPPAGDGSGTLSRAVIDRAVVELDVDEVRLADEIGDEARSRPSVDLLGCPNLLDAPFIHNRDAIGHRHRLPLIVGNEDERGADLPLNLRELDLEPLSQLEVQRAQRFVQQQDGRTVDQGASDRHALLLAT